MMQSGGDDSLLLIAPQDQDSEAIKNVFRSAPQPRIPSHGLDGLHHMPLVLHDVIPKTSPAFASYRWERREFAIGAAAGGIVISEGLER
eukprot:g14004.t1